MSDRPEAISEETLRWMVETLSAPHTAWRYGNRLFYLGDIARDLLEARRLLRLAHDTIDRFYGPPGSNNLERPLLDDIARALGRDGKGGA